MCFILNAGDKEKLSNNDFKIFIGILNETVTDLKKQNKSGSKGEFWKTFEEAVFKTMEKKLEDKKLKAKEEKDHSLDDWEVIYIKKSHRFPDITYECSKKIHGFGVEVKTISSRSKKWKINGGSILESTRVDDIEAIYVLCAKKKTPIDIICKKFEDCVVDVAVTHSPRYVLDMKAKAGDGQNYFEKHGTTYEDVRKNPVEAFKKILKNNSTKQNKNKTRWYDLDEEINYSKAEKDEKQLAQDFDMHNFVFWNELRTNKDKERKRNLIAQMFVDFPDEIFRGKYDNACKWLIVAEKIICKNMRDRFSSGGRESINSILVPKIYKNLSDYQKDIIQVFRNKKNNLSFKDWQNCVEKAIGDSNNKKYYLTGLQIKVVKDIIKNIECGIKNKCN